MLEDVTLLINRLHPLQLWKESQRFRYLIIGAWNTLAGYSIFALLYLGLSNQLSYMFIAIFSHLLAVTQSFITQRKAVFRSRGNWVNEYARFHVAHLGSLLIGLALLRVLVEYFWMTPLIAQALASTLIVLVSYFAHQHFTFANAARDKQ